MRTYEDGALTLPGSVIAIGAFDGVHKGHQAVIRQMLQRSEVLRVPSVVYTFDPPPRFYFQGVRLLTTIGEKLARIARLGIEHTVVAKFDEVYSARSAADFIDKLTYLNPLEIMVGEDFRFGKNREGNVSLLQRHFNVKVLQPVCCPEGQPISSTRIRQMFSSGDVAGSLALLGWPAEITGSREVQRYA